jgi:hypothetical protein
VDKSIWQFQGWMTSTNQRYGHFFDRGRVLLACPVIYSLTISKSRQRSNFSAYHSVPKYIHAAGIENKAFFLF